MAEETPLMRQYWSIKNAHADKILLFRMGDFYEMFFEDAVKAAPILGIALTSRNKKSADETPMCGVPYHSIATPINKLLASGLKVALCEQIEDPKVAKGIVKRAVTRVMTPGMVYDPETLEQTRSYFIACANQNSLACVDTSTGESLVWSHLSQDEIRELAQGLPIVEFLASDLEAMVYGGQAPVTLWKDLPKTPVPGLAEDHPLQSILSYVETSGLKISADVVRNFQSMTLQGTLELSSTTLKHLEIFQSSVGTSSGSLLASLDRTKTPMGARRLRQRLAFPMKNLSDINQELDRLENWIQKPSELKNIRSLLAQVGDLERRCLKIGLPTNNARDLLSLKEALFHGISSLKNAGFFEATFSDLELLTEKLDKTLREDPPLTIKQGFMIKSGVDPLLDEAILFSTEGQNMLAKFEEAQRNLSGISSLKVRYNQVFGYYIEITHTHKDKVPAHYLRKQTLANAERFTTEELIELERKIISAEVKRFDLELHLFEELRELVLKNTSKILTLARQISELDVLCGLSWLAIERNYVRPTLGKKPHIELRSCRHPVVEQTCPTTFIANDVVIEDGSTLLLTGPNMAGKSTLMRQVALLAIMAQAGSFVPAASAELPVFDRILTRIGANDSLSEGLSTFMVEMKETSEILNKATGTSLVLLDEIGRGTSTYDGMSLAQAILEHLLENVRAKVLFATHYHELTRLEADFPNLKNAHMAIRESGSEIQFLYSLRPGPALKSYGIQVAKLAQVPISVTKRAQEILEGLERSQIKVHQMSFWEVPPKETIESLDPILSEMQKIDLNQMTPVKALVKLEEWKNSLSVTKKN
jgi:DNA mismatch repair protein MutS